MSMNSFAELLEAAVAIRHGDFSTQTPPGIEKPPESLLAAFPSPEDIGILWQTGAHVPIYFLHRVMSTPYFDLERDGLDLPKTPFPMPGPDTHPVPLAKSMFLMVTLLQYLDPGSHEQIKYTPPLFISASWDVNLRTLSEKVYREKGRLSDYL
ncbi:hypothetical protein F5X96DRAFT_670220 [Biscogniauxia mediterranea]|nr:hypothetical protein F5X96DRAFT_670220 [Biscogniauxia mediterranea]